MGKVRESPDLFGGGEHGGAGPGAGQQGAGVAVVAARGQGQGDRAERVHGEFGGHGVAPVGQPQRHHVPGGEARSGEQGGDPADFGAQGRVGQRPGVVHQGGAVRVCADPGGEQRVQVGVRTQALGHPGQAVGPGHEVGEGHTGA
ncbi:hypothetical protein GCM10023100_02770 [Actinocorallia cavernae]|uniref:Uncharacterized protein n=1 Tax=Actinocorallia cavernae TaxID=328075 RepID=A0ABP8S9E5_9ACTN